MYSILNFDIPADIILAVLVGNTILWVIAVMGFRNLKLQIRDLKRALDEIHAKQKMLHEKL